MKAWQVAVAAATFGLVSTGAAWAACEQFTAKVPIDARHFEYSDINGDGQISPGDMLVGRDGLHGEGGNEIGRLFATVAINEVDDNGIVTKWADTQIYAMPDGGIFAYNGAATGKLDVREFESESFKQDNAVVTTQIIGGTGGYAGAGGTVEFSFTDGVGKFDVKVSCN